MHHQSALIASLPVVIVSLVAIWLCCFCTVGQTSGKLSTQTGFDPIWSGSINRNGPTNGGQQERSKRASRAASFVSPENCGTRVKMPSPQPTAIRGSSPIRKAGRRISNGTDLKASTSWPFFGTLMGESNETTLCGATILAPNLVITSATCGLAISNAGKSSSSLRLAIGSHLRKGDSFRGQVVWARDSCTASNYSIVPSINGANRSEFDFMLILLEEELSFNANLSASCLIKKANSDPGDEDEEKPEDLLDRLLNDRKSNCFVIAHHAVTSEDLRVRYSPVKKRKCWYEDHHDKLNFCFSAKDRNETLTVCKNDSGAPIYCRDQYFHWYLVGLVSTVMPDCKDLTGRGIYNVATSMSRMVATEAFQQCVDTLGVGAGRHWSARTTANLTTNFQ